MGILDSILLGILQGITEFLPVSSSGHLILLQDFLLGENKPPVAYDILLHIASLLAVILFFKNKILQLLKGVKDKEMKVERKEIVFIIISTLITAAAVPLSKPVSEFMKANPKYLIIAFLYTAVILIIADRLMKRKSGRENLILKDSLLIGLFQAVAPLPGISRSGSTICAGLISGLKNNKAVEYSFMLAIPAILGAGVLELRHLENANLDVSVLAFGFLSSFIASVLSLKLLVFMIKKTKLSIFAVYLVALSIFIAFK